MGQTRGNQPWIERKERKRKKRKKKQKQTVFFFGKLKETFLRQKKLLITSFLRERESGRESRVGVEREKREKDIERTQRAPRAKRVHGGIALI